MDEVKKHYSPSDDDMITLPAHPKSNKPREDIENAKLIANRYLNVAALEKIIKSKKSKQAKQKAAGTRSRMPETPEDFYDKGLKYLTGAKCAVPFQEKAAYYQKAAEMFAGAGNYHDAAGQAETCNQRAKTILEEGYQNAYQDAAAKKERAVTADDWFAAARAFERIPGYRDADALAEECEQRLSRKTASRFPLLLLALVLIVGLAYGGVKAYHTHGFRYQAAKAAYALHFSEQAVSLLEELGSYRDSEELLIEISYEVGLDKLEDENYGGAFKAFQKCGDYQDAAALLEQCHYYLGLTSMDKEDYGKAAEHFSKSGSYQDAAELLRQAEILNLQTAQLGDELAFGSINYLLLAREGDRCLLVSSGLNSTLLYNDTSADISWENSSIRAALNDAAYLDSHFSEGEQEMILPTQTSPSTTDQIFLLSQEEYLTYQSLMGEKDALWWLRDNGSAPGTAMFVSNDGTVMESGYDVTSPAIHGRTALWVSIAAQ